MNTHPEQWAAMLQRPGSSWGFGALLKDTSVMVLKEYTPPPTIPAGPEIQTHNLPLTSPTRYPLGHDCPRLIQTIHTSIALWLNQLFFKSNCCFISVTGTLRALFSLSSFKDISNISTNRIHLFLKAHCLYFQIISIFYIFFQIVFSSLLLVHL